MGKSWNFVGQPQWEPCFVQRVVCPSVENINFHIVVHILLLSTGASYKFVFLSTTVTRLTQ